MRFVHAQKCVCHLQLMPLEYVLLPAGLRTNGDMDAAFVLDIDRLNTFLSRYSGME